MAIGEYEHWEEEEWVDAANPDWQKFIGQLSQELNEKGVDGFFINNCDVYDYAPHESIFEGLTAILQNMMTFGKAVIINVGDTYVAEYRERYGDIDHIMTGVNQESVWLSLIHISSDPSPTQQEPNEPPVSPEPETPARAEQVDLTFFVEGEEEALPATLYVGDGYSLYIPDEDWDGPEQSTESGVPTDTWVCLLYTSTNEKGEYLSFFVASAGYRHETA